jgi:hypothetical protein
MIFGVLMRVILKFADELLQRHLGGRAKENDAQQR